MTLFWTLLFNFSQTQFEQFTASFYSHFSSSSLLSSLFHFIHFFLSFSRRMFLSLYHTHSFHAQSFGSSFIHSLHLSSIQFVCSFVIIHTVRKKDSERERERERILTVSIPDVKLLLSSLLIFFSFLNILHSILHSI